MSEKVYRFSASAIDEIKQTAKCQTPAAKTISFAHGRPGCRAASAVRADRAILPAARRAIYRGTCARRNQSRSEGEAGEIPLQRDAAALRQGVHALTL
jgi:hypothetical protein